MWSLATYLQYLDTCNMENIGYITCSNPTEVDRASDQLTLVKNVPQSS